MNIGGDWRGAVCPVCGCGDSSLLATIDLESQFREYAPGEPETQEALLEAAGLTFRKYHILLCGNCGLEYANPLAEPSPRWYEYAYNKLDFHASGRWEFDYVLRLLTESDRIGEIGCGTGVFLSKCRNKHIDAHGLDFSSTSVSQCLLKGLSASIVAVGDPKEMELGDQTKRNVIVSFHVIEHLADPHMLFHLATAWAADAATLWIAVPSNVRLQRLLNKRDILDEPPHHLTRWTTKAFETIGAKCGWALRSVVYEPLTLRQKLWGLHQNNKNRSLVSHTPSTRNKWAERGTRYFNYPRLAIRHATVLRKMSGFSMLAIFSNSELS